MAGWYRMHRGWMDSPLFANEPFDRARAWEWLIHEAAYEAHDQWFNGRTHRVERGQLIMSERVLALRWKWDRQRVRTFLRQLADAQNLTRAETHGVTQLSICNYERYQAVEPTAQPSAEPTPNPELTHKKPTTKEGKENTHPRARTREGQDYAFEGRIIRLNQTDYDRWKRTYHGIPDLAAELVSIDAWLVDQSEAKQKRWFQAVTGMLNRNHQDRLAAPKPASAPTPRSYSRNGEQDEFEAAMACGRAMSERAASGGYGPQVFPSRLKLVS